MARMSNLSPTTRSAIRDIGDGKLTIKGGISGGRAVGSILVRDGYATRDNEGRLSLTPKGQREYALIMESGDGPEMLKEMFRL